MLLRLIDPGRVQRAACLRRKSRRFYKGRRLYRIKDPLETTRPTRDRSVNPAYSIVPIITIVIVITIIIVMITVKLSLLLFLLLRGRIVNESFKSFTE